MFLVSQFESFLVFQLEWFLVSQFESLLVFQIEWFLVSQLEWFLVSKVEEPRSIIKVGKLFYLIY
jgi:hypothetical protein